MSHPLKVTASQWGNVVISPLGGWWWWWWGICSESPRRHCSVWIQVLINSFVASEQIGRGCWKKLLHVNVFRSAWDAAWYCSIGTVSGWASEVNYKMSGGRCGCMTSRQDTCKRDTRAFKSQCCSLQCMAPVKMIRGLASCHCVCLSTPLPFNMFLPHPKLCNSAH